MSETFMRIFDGFFQSRDERATDRNLRIEKEVMMIAPRFVERGGVDYDAFVEVARQLKEPAFTVGTAHDSRGDEIPIRLGVNDLPPHSLIQGGTGTGKTTFVTGFVAWTLGHGVPVGVIDCKAGFFDAAVAWAAIAAHALGPAARDAFRQRLAIVNPFGESLAPLNVCRVPPGSSPEVQAYEVTLAFSRLFDTALSLHMENILRHVLLLLMESELSLVEAPLVLADELVRGILVERSANPMLKDFFFRTYPTLPDTSKHALAARLQSLFLPESLRLMLGADDLVDLRGVVVRGDPLIVFLGKGAEAPEELVNVVGSLFLQLLFGAAYASGASHRPYTLVMDEFFHLLSPTLSERFATALTTLRGFNTHLALVMHNFAQVSPALRETMLANCDLVALFRTSSRGAEFFGDFLPDVDPELVADALANTGEVPGRQEMRRAIAEKLQRLPNRTAYWYDRRQPHRAVQIRVPDLPPPHEAAGISERELADLIDQYGINRGGIAVSRHELRRQVAARRERLQEMIRPPITLSTIAEEPVEVVPRRSARGKKPRLG